MMELGEVIGIAGLILGCAWLIQWPQFRRVSLVAALVATAAGEVVLLLACCVFDRYNIVNEHELLTAGQQLVAYLSHRTP